MKVLCLMEKKKVLLLHNPIQIHKCQHFKVIREAFGNLFLLSLFSLCSCPLVQALTLPQPQSIDCFGFLLGKPDRAASVVWKRTIGPSKKGKHPPDQHFSLPLLILITFITSMQRAVIFCLFSPLKRTLPGWKMGSKRGLIEEEKHACHRVLMTINGD